MGQPRNTLLAESITTDVIGSDYRAPTICAAFQQVVAARAGDTALRTANGGPSYTWIEYVDGPRTSEISDGEDGGGNSAPPTEEVGTGEDGGGNSAPPAERTGRGEDGGGNSAPPADARVIGLDEIATPGTSGTTGKPKGVEVTQATMVSATTVLDYPSVIT